MGVREIMTQTTYRARKGDICAIEQRHSSHSTMFKAQRWSTWYIGRVESATREGQIKSASADLPTDSGKPFPMTFREYNRAAASGWVGYTITNPAMRAAAMALIGREFQSGDDLRAAIQAQYNRRAAA
jgi:hypothetical protein